MKSLVQLSELTEDYECMFIIQHSSMKLLDKNKPKLEWK